MGIISGLVQWVKGSGIAIWIQSLAQVLPYAMGTVIKKNSNNKIKYLIPEKDRRNGRKMGTLEATVRETEAG